MKKAIAAGAIAGLALAGAGAGVANAAYPPEPSGGTSSVTETTPGQPVTFTCGFNNGFLAGSTVNWVTEPSGPSTTTSAGADGLSSATFTFTNPGVFQVVATGTGANGPLECRPPAVTITAGPGPTPTGTPHPTKTPAPKPTHTGGAGGGGKSHDGGTTAGGGGTSTTTGGGLAQTGGNNTLTIAAVGAGLLLAGVGAVVVARRRESNA